MKRFVLCCLTAILITAAGCSFVSTPVISDASEPESSTASEISEASSVSSSSDLNLPSNEFSLTTEYTFEADVMTTTDWQSYEDSGNLGIKTFSLTFPDYWISDGEGATTFHDQNTGIKVFESAPAVKLASGFDFIGSFLKENFEEDNYDTRVVGDITFGTIHTSEGEMQYALVVKTLTPEGGGEIQIDRWYPYFYVIVDGNYAYCMQFYSLEDPAADDTNADLFREIMGTFKVIA